MTHHPIVEFIVHSVQNLPPSVRHVADTVAAGTAVAAWVKWLPPAAAFMSIIWIGLQIFTWFETRYKKRRSTKSKK